MLVGVSHAALAAETTYQRLLNARAEPQNWLMRMGNYDNWNYSALDQINHGNVANLKVKFMAAISDPDRPSKGNQYFTPLVEDGFLYVGNQCQQYWKFDVRDEKPKIVWKYDAKVQGGGQSLTASRCSATTSTSTPARDSPNPRLIALDKNSGAGRVRRLHRDRRPRRLRPFRRRRSRSRTRSWSARPGATKAAAAIVSAYSADTGKFLWRFSVVPEPGEPGSETWADPRTIAFGGGGVWTEPSYDPETNLAYFGTGNPVHMFDPQGRPGDNLYTSSIIALDVDTGKLKWYFQTIANEGWDYDAVAITQLYDVTIGGETRKVISQTNRNGFHYILDRANGQFLRGEPFTEVNWTAGLDQKTGKPVDYDPTKKVQDYAGRADQVRQEGDGRAPRPLRHADLHAQHLRSAARADLLPGHDRAGQLLQLTRGRSREGRPRHRFPRDFLRQPHQGERRRADRAQRHQSQLQGQPRPARRHRHRAPARWRRSSKSYYPAYSGVLGTAGGLLFMGDIMGKISAFDKDTMQELWSFETGTQFAGNPMTYAVNGKQYIALTLGGRPGRDEGSFPEAAEIPQNVMLMVFGL